MWWTNCRNNRTHEMMHTLTSTACRKNDFCEAFGNELTILENYVTPSLNTATLYHGIPGGQSQTVLFKPLLGLLNQTKFLPLSKMGSMTLELELVDDINEPIIMPDAYISTDPVIAGIRFSIANTSNNWQIQNVQVKTGLITLDNGLQNTYDAHLLSGNAYPINYNTFITQSQNVIGGADAAGLSLGQQKINLSVSRAVTRLKSVFITLDKAIPYENDEKARKPWNDFYSPMHSYATPYERVIIVSMIKKENLKQ